MNEWVKCVEDGVSIENCYPINVPATKEYSTMLKTRLDILEQDDILSELIDSINDINDNASSE